ncbi:MULTISPECIES: heme A synthase [unclassified Cyanobium]|uniref:COX15/CtaA family protein n=1 Tax=unclassified Cyanobium TaxID=2627006 RepID=UPI0020CF4C51|nr:MULTISPECIES: COX15/CtaA family protein [unclassified Cyanobium]MCP9858406.1 COX15/CtaA family protein [Cyanobium sp. Cruz-8H5]MCP9865510.1 COX15/CtaA family protein [Cyanobium sp. Cruz-8D1]
MAVAPSAQPQSRPRSTAGARWPRRLVPLLTAHLVVALVALVAIGGATRVMEAGLACPDWPLCYGVLWPGRQWNLQVFLEWFHRLDAFLVGVALLLLFALSLRFRARFPGWLPWSSGLALALVAVQGGLGALTVLSQLAAPTVTLHLATALSLVLLLSAMHQGLERPDPQAAGLLLPRWWSPLPFLAALLVGAQCLLGGAMASRWAADLCVNAGEGCRWLLLHRQGAYPAAIAVLVLAAGSLALPTGHRRLQALSLTAAALVAVQVALGVFTLRLQLAVPAVTVAHQLTAALLVAVLGALCGLSFQSPSVPTRLEVAHG